MSPPKRDAPRPLGRPRGPVKERAELKLLPESVKRLDSLRGPLTRSGYLDAVLEALDSADSVRALDVLARLIEHHRGGRR